VVVMVVVVDVLLDAHYTTEQANNNYSVPVALAYRWRRVQLSDVSFPDNFKPLATFAAGGRTYYIDVKNFPDEKLLARLTPMHPAAVAAAAAAEAARAEDGHST